MELPTASTLGKPDAVSSDPNSSSMSHYWIKWFLPFCFPSAMEEILCGKIAVFALSAENKGTVRKTRG